MTDTIFVFKFIFLQIVSCEAMVTKINLKKNKKTYSHIPCNFDISDVWYFIKKKKKQSI